MDPEMIQRLQGSFNKLAGRGEELVDRFYAHLFSKHREVREMFPSEMAEQKRKLLASLVFVIQNIKTPDKLQGPLRDLGARHARFGTKPEHYPVVRNVLVSVMAEMSGDGWNEQLTEDWNMALDCVASVMLTGAQEVQGVSTAS